MNWELKRVCVTGGSGFLGSFLVEELRAQAPRIFSFPAAVSTISRSNGTSSGCSTTPNPIVFHLTAAVGGIGANRENPGRVSNSKRNDGNYRNPANSSPRRREDHRRWHDLRLSEIRPDPVSRRYNVGWLSRGKRTRRTGLRKRPYSFNAKPIASNTG